MEVINKRLDAVERDIKELKSKDKNLETSLKQLNDKLDSINEGQYEQKLINQDLSYTMKDFRKDLARQSKERKEQSLIMEKQSKDTRETKRWQIGIGITIAIPFLHSLFQMFFFK
ncbi:hypothetical protein GJU84_04920 [Staphylococcus chromogenes]|uniref:DUF2951 domain-containing protein n=1 Tax=Staphylococcus agnetis TaxID=985762 RepID=A0ABD7TR82_9STAP|nr:MULTISPECIES: hypothetical protein [Staphylococcus]ALN76745.1 hypothetical protein EP23_04770 [Staphylococcus agnetis]MDG4942804.1 hypothetical protein [Staphylococcus agnetis]OSP20434.1 hypothetical protein B9L42_05635 [Staphylococcus agnetis]OSP25123.1 hypothetical protein B9M87_00790 [Staphylococcus agnetis]OTW31148.1 hypothetical protein B9M88_06720 [Staphylococcus agnetis]